VKDSIRYKLESVKDRFEEISGLLADPDEPYLLDVIVEPEANVYPMIPAGATYRDIIMSDDDLQDVSGESQGSNV